MGNTKLLTIAIPTYNRPQELKRLLNSIDSTNYDDIDIVISENGAPSQKETRIVVEEFKNNSCFHVDYHENLQNIGYDKNIRKLVEYATGRFCMFFSDDDMFMPGALDQFLDFVKKHIDVGYILRSYRNYKQDGTYQDFRYFSTDREFPAGMNSAIELFDMSVFLSGFTIRSEYAKQYVTDALDGSLLYQLYLLLEVCKRYPSAYSRIIISKAVPDENTIHYFGECEEEKDSFVTGQMGGDNQLNFMRWYIKVIDFFSEKYNDDTSKRIKHKMSKYSYINLVQMLQFNPTKEEYNRYCKELEAMGLNSSYYYYFYKIVLKIFGYKFCNKCIAILKRIIGYRPKL